MRKISKKGFTLIEILLVVAAIGILAAIVIVAVNPGRQIGQTQNAQRSADVNTIISAISQYQVDNNGSLPSEISSSGSCSDSSNEICKTDSGSCSGLIELSELTDDDTYIPSIPTDPSATSSDDGTGYHVIENSNGRVTVCAPLAGLDETIEATR